MKKFYLNKIKKLKAEDQYRFLKKIPKGKVNFSANDYLGIAADETLREEFYALHPNLNCGSTSSRLLSGNYEGYELLESELASAYQREAALVVNSGYHCNVGLLQALSQKGDLILSDKLNHASIVDGTQLCQAKVVRYRHNDLDHLEQLLQTKAADFDKVFIVSESIFSMDGDRADLKRLVDLKTQFAAMLIIDEAHSVGVCGEQGLGLAEECDLIADVDIIIGTFGKAFASAGAYLICDEVIKEYLINFMRTLIFTTALPPIIVAWNRFVFQKNLTMQSRRQHLSKLIDLFSSHLGKNFNSPIIPIIFGDNHKTVLKAEQLQQKGFTVFPIRPPTVPFGTSRLRLSLSATMSKDDILKLLEVVDEK